MKQKQVHKSNWLVTMLMLVMAILMPYGGAWAQTEPSSGDGSVGNPYKISTAAELAWFRDEVNNGRNDICAKIADGVKIIDLKDFCHAKVPLRILKNSVGLLLVTILIRFMVHLMATERPSVISTSMPPLIIPVSSAMLMLAESITSLSTMRR